ncbi:MAG: hypothetical protein AAGC60_04690 [Acidobacteriota bacterium]
MTTIQILGVAILLALTLSLTAGCTVGQSFRGPGFDPGLGVTAEGAGETVVVAITHTTVASGWSKRRSFSRHLWDVVDTMPDHPGLVGYSVRRDLFGADAWTLSVWTTEQALSSFLRSPVHASAVEDGGRTLTSLRRARAEVATDEIPLGWPRALEILEAQNGGTP